MRNFPAGFITEKDRQRGSRPAWILKIMVSGSPVYMSDRIITNFQDPETGAFVSPKAWVTKWGQITEGITGSLGEFSVGEFTVTLAVDQTDSNNIMILVDNHDIESERATLFAWYETGLGMGVLFPGQVVFSGYVKEPSFGQNDVAVTLTLQDDTLRLQGMVGGIVDQETFPGADPDDIGKVIPVVFGTLEKFPTLAIDAGIKTNLTAGMTAVQMTMNVSDAAGFWIGMWCGIDDETVLVTEISGSTITITRAQDATVAATHQRGADIIEIRPNDFAYLISDHPIQAVAKVWGRIGGKLMDITSICTVYTGQTGHEHATYLGRGVVTVPGFITISQAALLMLNDGIGVSDLLAVVDGLGVSDAITITDGKGVAHTFSISDGKVWQDGIDVSDTIGLSNLLSVLDQITVGDNIAVSSTIDISDAIEVGDNIVVTPTIEVSDTIGVSQGSHPHTTYNATIAQAGNNAPQGDYRTSGSFAQLFAGNVNFPAHGINPANIVDVTYEVTFQAWKTTSVYIYAIGASFTFYNAAVALVDGTQTMTWTVSHANAYAATGIGVQLYCSGAAPVGVWVTAVKRTFRFTNTSSTDAAAGVAKTGGAARTGTVTKTGGASRTGSATRTGGLSRTGNASRGGSASLGGTLTKTGTADKTGTITPTGAITLPGGVSLTGTVDRAGNVTRTGNVTRSGAVAKTGTVTLTGNSVANTLIGDAILVDVVGLAENTPQTAIGWLLANYADYAGTVTQIGNYPSGYTLNGAITESNAVLYWVNRLAFEFRSFFKFQSGAARLIVRPDSFTAIKTITRTQIENFTRSKTAYEDIINQVGVRYNRDYTKSKGLGAYQGITPPGTNSVSISKYGRCQKDDMFLCDFITSEGLAISVRDFFLTRYSSRHWLYTLDCYLDQLELEFGDQVGTVLRNGVAGMVKESGIAPGNSAMDRVILKIEL